MHFRYPLSKVRAYHIWREFRRQKIFFKSMGTHKTVKKFDLAEFDQKFLTIKEEIDSAKAAGKRIVYTDESIFSKKT